MNYGDLGKRFVACLIDSFILSVIGFFLGLTLSVIGVAIAPIVSLLYYILMEGGGWHATLGKKAMGLYIADENGNGITYAASVLRLIGKVLSSAILGIGYIMALFSEQKQALHDMIAKTYVLNGSAQDRYVRGPELIGISGPLAGMKYTIGREGLIIGRDSVSCQVVIPLSQEKIGRTHCFVTFNPVSGMFILNDRNSTNGTFLSNGTRVSYAQPAALRSGDRFYLATPENTFEVR